jgi:hypothetical protein
MAELPMESLYEGFMWELLRSRRSADQGDAPVEHLPAHAGTEDEVLDFILTRAVEEGVLPRTGSRELVRRLFEVFRGGALAIDRYQPGVFHHAVTLLRASNPLPEVLRPAHDRAGSLYGDATHGWDRYVAGHLQVIETPGDHLTMIEQPNITGLAAHVAEVLASTTWSHPTSFVA